MSITQNGTFQLLALTLWLLLMHAYAGAQEPKYDESIHEVEKKVWDFPLELRRPVPADQFDEETHVWLSRGVIGESGWERKDDQIAIAFVLAKRWLRLRLQVLDASFHFMVREYPAGMGFVERGSQSRRTHTIRRLPAYMPATNSRLMFTLEQSGWGEVVRRIEKPSSWSSSKAMNWEIYAEKWNAVLIRMKDWSLGKYEDPCPDAMHWGAPNGVDLARAKRAGWKVVDCGDTANVFYSLRSKK